MIEFSVDHAKRIRTATFTGVVDDAELIGAYQKLVASPDYDGTLNDLVDLRAVERLEVSREALAGIVSMFTPLDVSGATTRLAMVAGSDLTFGISRMYELLRGDDVPEEIRVFRDYDAAVAWLTERGAR